MKRITLLGVFYSIIAPAILYGQCTSTPQVNAVINGDFESGYIASGPGSITTDQIYVYDPVNAPNSAKMDAILANPNGNLPCAWNSDGRYHIASYFGTFKCDGGNYNGHPFLSESDGRYDHTQGIGGTGKYMMIDSKNGAAGGLGITLWEQDVTVVPNSQYYFSGWFINFSPVSNGTNRVALRFVVEYFNSSNVSLGVFQLGSTFSPADASRGNNWEQAYVTTTSPAGAVTARIGIYNQTANVLVGNDVAIDDISFSNGCQAVAGATNPPTPNLGVDQNLCAVNGNITLNSSVATNAPTREFSWFSVSGGTETALVSNSTTQNTYTITTPGTYRVCVYEPTGCAKSDYIIITATNAISLGADVSLCQPNSSSATFTGTLTTSGASYTYSWLKNGSPIAGTTNSQTVSSVGTYTINATHPTRAACNVSDAVIANTNPLTTNIGADVNICSTTSNNFQQTFTSSLTGTSFTYQWQKNGVNIPGATTFSYTADTAATYRLNITHPVAGCSFFDDVIVTNPTTMTTNIGTDKDLCTSSNAVFTSSLTHLSFQYRWLKDGVVIPGATTSSYSATIPGVYRLEIRQNTAGCFLFDDATVSSTNVITANNANFCAPPAIPVGLSVSGPGTFNWFSVPTGGAAVATNTSTFTTPAISATTTYYVQDMTSASGTALPGSTYYNDGQDYNYHQTEKGMEFQTLKPNVTLNTVDFWVGTYSTVPNLVVCLRNSSGGVITSVNIPSMGPTSAVPIKYTVPLNISIPSTGTYQLILCGGSGGSLQAQLAPTNVTEASNTITFTQGLTLNSWENKLNYFQNVTFNAGTNPCARTPVTAYLTGTCPLPILDWGDDKDQADLTKLEMSVYPNPTQSTITVELESGVDQAEYKLTEMNGRKVMEGRIYAGSTKLDVHALPKGIYILEVQNSDKINFMKIIKE